MGWCFDREIRDKSISTLHHRKKLSGGISHYKIARYIDGITSRDSNHLPHDSFRSSSANEKSVHLGIIKNLSIKFQINRLSHLHKYDMIQKTLTIVLCPISSFFP